MNNTVTMVDFKIIYGGKDTIRRVFILDEIYDYMTLVEKIKEYIHLKGINGAFDGIILHKVYPDSIIY